MENLTLQDDNIRYRQRHLATVNDNDRRLATESQGPDIKKMFLASFLKIYHWEKSNGGTNNSKIFFR